VHELSEAVLEIERHVSESGWDQPARLFALVRTADLLAAEPQLAEQLGPDAARHELTPVAQDGLPPGAGDLTDALARIEWPEAVTGCAVAVERVVLPQDADAGAGTVTAVDVAAAAQDPRRHEVRMVGGVLRDGTRFGAVRLRTHDQDDAVLSGADLVPTLCEVLALTFAGDSDLPDTSGGTADEEAPR
jgi:hypothetical protein